MIFGATAASETVQCSAASKTANQKIFLFIFIIESNCHIY